MTQTRLCHLRKRRRVLGPHCQPRTPPGSEQTWLHVDTPASLEHAPQRWSTWVDSLARALPNNLLARAHLIAVHIRVIGRGFGARGRRWVGEAHARLCEWIRCAVAHGDRTRQHGRRNDPHKQGPHGER